MHSASGGKNGTRHTYNNRLTRRRVQSTPGLTLSRYAVLAPSRRYAIAKRGSHHIHSYRNAMKN